MRLRGTLLLKPTRTEPVAQHENLAILEDGQSWDIERAGRDGDEVMAVQVPADDFRIEDLKGVKVRSQQRKRKQVALEIEKELSGAFQDRLWRLFDGIQCEALSASYVEPGKGRLYSPANPSLEAGDRSLGLAVVAVLGNRAFFVVAKDERDYSNCQAYLQELAAWRKHAQSAATAIEPSLRAHIVLWYSNPGLPSEDELAAANRYGILLLCGAHVTYYQKMTEEPRIGRYSFVRDLFRGESWATTPRSYPAIRVQAPQARDYFVCVGKPEELMQLCRVDRRSPVREQSYQRLLRVDKIRNARQYLQRVHGGVRGAFGNAIVLVSEGEIAFEATEPEEDPGVGRVKIPSTFGLLSVVDGQHRLYSYMDTDRQGVRELPFILFPRADEEFARSMFVAINDNQQRVPPELMWDIQADSEPDRDVDESTAEYRKFMIARMARQMATNRGGPLYQRVQVFGLPEGLRVPPHLTLTTLCRGLNKLACLRLLRQADGFTVRRRGRPLDEEADVARRAIEAMLGSMFSQLHADHEQEWEQRGDGRIFNNSAFTVHLYFLDKLIARWPPPNATTETLTRHFQDHFRVYSAYWGDEMRRDDKQRHNGTGQPLNVSLASGAARDAFANRALEHVEKAVAKDAGKEVPLRKAGSGAVAKRQPRLAA